MNALHITKDTSSNKAYKCLSGEILSIDQSDPQFHFGSCVPSAEKQKTARNKGDLLRPAGVTVAKLIRHASTHYCTNSIMTCCSARADDFPSGYTGTQIQAGPRDLTQDHVTPLLTADISHQQDTNADLIF
ncbi:hypothetical protein AC579_5738 [Pseudocercospora musae]|uniref:Uncharacterized protein n=1 Tax=Pseudocercospora musae TaxID=113226 RepID=A0A139IRT8_9PEZI|nr:hypothetical protein AC579_5738 [Pseudocercospora musae]